jgi:hypothetical protein
MVWFDSAGLPLNKSMASEQTKFSTQELNLGGADALLMFGRNLNSWTVPHIHN